MYLFLYFFSILFSIRPCNTLDDARKVRKATTNPNIVNFPIPANDDSIKTIQLILNYISNSLYDMLGHNQKEDGGPSGESNVDNDQAVNE